MLRFAHTKERGRKAFGISGGCSQGSDQRLPVVQCTVLLDASIVVPVVHCCVVAFVGSLVVRSAGGSTAGVCQCARSRHFLVHEGGGRGNYLRRQTRRLVLGGHPQWRGITKSTRRLLALVRRHFCFLGIDVDGNIDGALSMPSHKVRTLSAPFCFQMPPLYASSLHILRLAIEYCMRPTECG